MIKARVLVCDDKENFVKLLLRILPEDRFDVTTAGDGARALALLAAGDFDVVVTDIRMPGADGMTVLGEARARDPDVEVVLMTAYATVPAAVDAMRQGAFDYLAKPFEPDEALLVVERALERRRLRQQARDLRRALEGIHRIDNLVARSPAMTPVLALVHRAAASDPTVLVTGESGTGKEVVARAIHSSGERSARPFVAVNCGAIPEALLESELFGHVKGSFTGANADHRGLFEEAGGGTIFLDEIADLPLSMQVKLNRVLQERKVRRVGATDERSVDVRVIAATNVDLKARVAAGQFREDLFYRLSVFVLELPPLRRRREDLPLLVHHFAEQFARHLHRPVPRIEAEVLDYLAAYDWPGNVRELEHLVQRALLVCRDNYIRPADLPILDVRPAAEPDRPPEEFLPLDEQERQVIQRALRACNWVMYGERGAARLLGIHPERLRAKMRKYGLRRPSKSTARFSS